MDDAAAGECDDTKGLGHRRGARRGFGRFWKGAAVVGAVAGALGILAGSRHSSKLNLH